MKKLTKTLVAVACAATLSAGAIAITACGNSGKTGEAYGLSHGAGYVSYATVTVKGEKVTNATLTEVCLPTYVTPDASVAEADKVAAKVLNHGAVVDAVYYKTISFNNVTFTYDGTLDGEGETAVSKGYMNGTQTLLQYLQTEANCKAYYEAVKNNNLIVKVGGQDKKDIMTYAKLSKEENGYWTVKPNAEKNETFEQYSQWKFNRDATVKYVKDNGVAGLASLKKATENNVKLPNGADKMAWVDNNGVSTGATWSDMFKDAAPANYLTYAQLLTKAYNAAK